MDCGDHIETDNNRSLLISNEFQKFTKSNGIHSASYHATTNEEAECCIQTFKKAKNNWYHDTASGLPDSVKLFFL